MKPIKTILSVLLTVVLAFSCTELENPNNGDNNGSNNGTNDSITLEFTEKEASASEQTFSVGVASSGDWIVTAETPVSWCSVTKETSTTAVVTISENKEYDSRSATFVFKCGNASAKLTITQHELGALIVTTSEYEIEAEGGEISIPISTNLDYKVEFEGDAASWIKVKELKTKSLEDCTLVIEISENVGNERIGVLNLISENIKVPITITQRCYNVIYYTTTDNKVLNPYYPTAFDSTIESNVYENGIGKITFSGPVTTIGDYAFFYCSNLTSIKIPNSVTSIGMDAFSNCSNLTSIEIPNSVTTIGMDAFSNCSNLTSITIPNSVTSIGDSAFGGCSSLTSFYGKYASEDNRCLIIDGVLNSFAPAGLTTYTIPNSVTSIGGAAFMGCSSLTSINIPNSVTSIGEWVFCGCKDLTSFYGKYASEDNRCLIVDGELTSFAPAGLTEYTIPNTVTSIGKGVFYVCTSLISVEIPNSVTSIGAHVFDNCSSLTSAKIPNSITAISAYAFHGCSSLTSIEIPNSVTLIGDRAFERCSILPSINIPDSVTSIGAFALSGCFKLTSIQIPSSVTSIGDKAFMASSLSSVYCKPTTPPTLGSGVYSSNSSSLKIYVPSASVAAYIAAPNWSDYASRIVGFNFGGNNNIPQNEIWYTSIDGQVITPYRSDGFGANIVSNEYINGSGIIKFDGDVTSITNNAFFQCTSLTSITIPDSVTSIGNYVFAGCSSLAAFNGKYASEDNRCLIIDGVLTSFASSGLTSYTIPSSVTAISAGALQYSTTLTSVNIPDSVTSIGNYAFQYCTSLVAFYGKFASEDNRCLIVDGVLNSFAPADLSSYTIPSSVTAIGFGIFYGCKSLTSIEIPTSVTSIENKAFFNCSNLTTVYCKPTTPPTLGVNVFYNTSSDLKINVPTASVDSYKAATNWSSYASKIIGF